jgi:hypothetical protein
MKHHHLEASASIAANELMTMFITKLNQVVKELERCGGNINLMKSDLKISLTQLERALPTSLKEKITKHIKSPEKDHASSIAKLKDAKAKLQQKRQEKQQAREAAMDFFKIFLPDMWVTAIQEKYHREMVSQTHKSEETLGQTNKHIFGSNLHNKAGSVSMNHKEREEIQDIKHQEANRKLISIYNIRLEAIRKAIEVAGGDVAQLPHDIKAEITALQTILPDGQLKMLNAFMEGAEKGQEVALALKKQQEKIATELADTTLESVSLGMILIVSAPSRSIGHEHEASLKHPISPSKAETLTHASKKSDFSIADMEAYNRLVSGEQ